MCNLIWCYVDMLLCFAWLFAQLLDQRPSYRAVVRHISVLNKSLPRFPLFHSQRLCEFYSSLAVMVSAKKGSCSYTGCIHCTALPGMW